jgi:hypothetical protein
MLSVRVECQSLEHTDIKGGVFKSSIGIRPARFKRQTLGIGCRLSQHQALTVEVQASNIGHWVSTVPTLSINC